MDVFQHLTGTVQTKDGIVSINRGDPIPDNLVKGERARLEGLNAIGQDAPTFGEKAHEDELDAEALAAAQNADLEELIGGDAVPSPAVDATEPAAAASAPGAEVEQPVEPAPGTAEVVEAGAGTPGTLPDVPTIQSSNEDIDAYVAAANVEQISEAAASPEMAQALLESELHLHSEDGKARKSLVTALTERGAKTPEA